MDKVVHHSKGRLAYALVAISWLIYAAVSIFAPRGGDTYHIGHGKLILLQLTVIIPVLFIWMTAAYGAVKFRAYSDVIRTSPDGRAIKNLTTGLYLLLASFIIQTLTTVVARLSVGTRLLYPAVFLHNHLAVVLALVSAGYIYEGSSRLAAIVHTRASRIELLPVLIGFAAASLWLGWYLYNHISHTVKYGVPNFTLPGHVPFYTIYLPYLVAWLLSILAILNIISYTRKVKGDIYRKGLLYAATGMVISVTFAMMIQILTFLNSAFNKLPLNSVLVLVYAILVMYALGFILIAAGARKLAQIEVVQ
ncbi:MAG: hypothetical protein NVSMB39_3240 [Candidatus Saccharimonadales bacterium]